MAVPAEAAGPCPECGVHNALDHNYCKHCGTPLRSVDVERELSTGFAERSRDRCLRLLNADPDNPHTHFSLGIAYYHLGMFTVQSLGLAETILVSVLVGTTAVCVGVLVGVRVGVGVPPAGR